MSGNKIKKKQSRNSFGALSGNDQEYTRASASEASSRKTEEAAPKAAITGDNAIEKRNVGSANGGSCRGSTQDGAKGRFDSVIRRISGEIDQIDNQLSSGLKKLEELEAKINNLVELREQLCNYYGDLNGLIKCSIDKYNKLKSRISGYDDSASLSNGSSDQSPNGDSAPELFQRPNNTSRASRPSRLSPQDNDSEEDMTQPNEPSKLAREGLNYVPITQNLGIMARIVQDWREAEMGQNGVIYYVEPNRQFTVKINGEMLHGNIGTIFSNENNPVKIKTCKYNKTCTKHNCTYFHDPKYNYQSADIRNFMASSWIYSTANDKKIRRYGSRQNLDHDIRRINCEERERYKAQTMHELLCSIVLCQNSYNNNA